MKKLLILLFILPIACSPTKKLSVRLDGKPIDAEVVISTTPTPTPVYNGSAEVNKKYISNQLVFTVKTSKGNFKNNITREKFNKNKEIILESSYEEIKEKYFDKAILDSIAKSIQDLESSKNYIEKSESILIYMLDNRINNIYKENPNSAMIPISKFVNDKLIELDILKRNIEDIKKIIEKIKYKLLGLDMIDIDEITKLKELTSRIKLISLSKSIKVESNKIILTFVDSKTNYNIKKGMVYFINNEGKKHGITSDGKVEVSFKEIKEGGKIIIEANGYEKTELLISGIKDTIKLEANKVICKLPNSINKEKIEKYNISLNGDPILRIEEYDTYYIELPRNERFIIKFITEKEEYIGVITPIGMDVENINLLDYIVLEKICKD